jgi:hypothetical protein
VSRRSPAENDEPFDVARGTAHPERIYDYLIGGDDHFAADRKAADEVFGVFPGGTDAGRNLLREVARFFDRVVRFVGAAGIRHELAQEVAPGSRVLYVVRDMTVLARAHRLRRDVPEGAVQFVYSDLHRPAHLVRQVDEILDLTRPVALIMRGTLSYLADDRDPYGLVATIMDALPPGSYLVATHMASDLRPDEMDKATRLYRERASGAQGGFMPRTHAEVERFFHGLELVGPGVVAIERWRPDGAAPSRPERETNAVYGAVGRKP